MITNSIVGKLWIAMLCLMIVVLTISGLANSQVVTKLIMQHQQEELKEKADTLLSKVTNTTSERELNDMAELLGVNLTIVNDSGNIEHCAGLGGSIAALESHDSTTIFEWLPSPETMEPDTVLSYQGPSNALGENVISIALPMPDRNGCLLVSELLDPIQEQVEAVQKMTLYSGVGGLLITAVLGLFFSQTLSRPVIKMIGIARSMSDGDFKRRVEVRTGDEIGILAGSLNTLAQRLDESIAEIHRLDNTRRDFVAGITHELRTPIAIIQAYTEAIQDGVVESETEKKRYLNEIAEEVVRLKRLTDELLDLRRLEAGAVEIRKERLNVVDLIENTKARFEQATKEKEIALSAQFAADLPPIEGQLDKLEQVLGNLTHNALRFTPRGGKITLAAEHQESWVTISVSDSGPGIPAEERALVWERFYKVDRSRSREADVGSGLGLAIVKSIIEAHGGTVDITESESGGSKFILRFPAA